MYLHLHDASSSFTSAHACSAAMAEVHLLSRKPGYHDLRMQSTMAPCPYRLGGICNHIRSRHHGQSGHIRRGSLHKPLPELPVQQHEWVLVQTSLAPWNVDRAAPDVDEYRPIGSDRDSAIGHALNALDLTNTEQTHRTVVWQPAVTHATHVVQPYEITRHAVDREVHHYHHLHRTLPVTDFQILPAKHFVENGRGSYTEVSGENKPLNSDDETELLHFIDDSASKEARAEMARVEAEPTPTPRKERGTPYHHGKDGQSHHYLHHPAHGTIHDSANAARAPIMKESRTTAPFWHARSLPSEHDRGSDEIHAITRVESRRDIVDRPESPASDASIAKPFQAGENTQSTQYQRHDSHPLLPKHVASRKTPFFQKDATSSRPLDRGSMQAEYVRHQATDWNIPHTNSISPVSEFAGYGGRMLRTERERGPTLKSLSIADHLSDRLDDASPHLLASAMGPERATTSGLTRSAESAPSLTKASPGLLLDHEHSCPSCGVPKLIRSPTTSGIRAAHPSDLHRSSAAIDVSDSRSRLPRPASTNVASDLPDSVTRISTSVSQKPLATPNEVPVAASRVQGTRTSFLPAAYAKAAERTKLPSAPASAAATSSQPRSASRGMYLNYSNFRLSEEI
ncbi:hypothetical protein AC579_2013 [Pseudocercospora musae]|uniref:Uncharacterized protein n=1 Tax=Pseudocercospora musae TaxID=113226 RepID=A0A139IR88_9PEZI|nr:hypothetical protein AC579_2013 [Pseudocercospora musae]